MADATGCDVRLLGPGDAAVLDRVAADVFDLPLDARLGREFLDDPRHHVAVAVDRADGTVVGFVSAVHYVHPDKPAELWINEVGVAPTHQRRGLARQLLAAMLAHGRTLGCAEAWVATEEGNAPARALYAAAGGEDAAESFRMYTFPLGPR